MRRRNKDDETVANKLDSFLGKGIVNQVTETNMIVHKETNEEEHQKEEQVEDGEQPQVDNPESAVDKVNEATKPVVQTVCPKSMTTKLL